ncbi:MAG: hypothetical protein K6U14_01085 [Firmicutes bacterium]|nr:hypothetical protein [Alicyclobacillaceae bacterium]MCL6496213.1 hypothetical protein [Bacillota bacterium]
MKTSSETMPRPGSLGAAERILRTAAGAAVLAVGLLGHTVLSDFFDGRSRAGTGSYRPWRILLGVRHHRGGPAVVSRAPRALFPRPRGKR